MALAFGIDQTVCVGAGISIAHAAILVVAVIAHALGIVLLVLVRALQHLGCPSLHLFV